MSYFYKEDKASTYKERLDTLKNNKVRSLYSEKIIYHKAEHELITKNKVKDILVIGLGMGRDIAWVKSLYPKASITGIDINEDYVKSAKENYGIEGYNVDLNEFLFKRKYDLIISFNTVAFIPEFQNGQLLKKLTLFLSSEGLLIFNYPYEKYFLAKRLQKSVQINRYYRYMNFTMYKTLGPTLITNLHLTCYSSVFDKYIGTNIVATYLYKLIDAFLKPFGPNLFSQSCLMIVKRGD